MIRNMAGTRAPRARAVSNHPVTSLPSGQDSRKADASEDHIVERHAERALPLHGSEIAGTWMV